MVYLLFKARHLKWLDAHVHKLSIVLAVVVSHSALLSLGDSPNYLFCKWLTAHMSISVFFFYSLLFKRVLSRSDTTVVNIQNVYLWCADTGSCTFAGGFHIIVPAQFVWVFFYISVGKDTDGSVAVCCIWRVSDQQHPALLCSLFPALLHQSNICPVTLSQNIRSFIVATESTSSNSFYTIVFQTPKKSGKGESKMEVTYWAVKGDKAPSKSEIKPPQKNLLIWIIQTQCTLTIAKKKNTTLTVFI